MSGIQGLVALTAVFLLLAGCGRSGTGAAGDGSPPSASLPASASRAPTVSERSKIPAAVTGVVRDATGQPVRGALVAAVSLDKPSNPVPELAVLTDERGHYIWPASILPGRYELHVTTAEGTAAKRVTVPPEGSASADLTLRR